MSPRTQCCVMARKPVKKASASKPKKAAKKAAKATKSPARKVAKPAARKAPAPKASKSSAHEAKMREVRQRVARHRPGEAPMVPHMHEQQDASIIPPPQPPIAPVDHLHGNYGDAKARSVARNDNPTNWFRQAPKPKAK